MARRRGTVCAEFEEMTPIQIMLTLLQGIFARGLNIIIPFQGYDHNRFSKIRIFYREKAL